MPFEAPTQDWALKDFGRVYLRNTRPLPSSILRPAVDAGPLFLLGRLQLARDKIGLKNVVLPPRKGSREKSEAFSEGRCALQRAGN